MLTFTSMSKPSTLRDLIILFVSAITLQLIIWLPHLFAMPNFLNLNFSTGFTTIYRNYDGLNYIVIAKSLYNPTIISAIPNTLTPSYYAAHFPGFAIAILAFAPILGFLKSMLFVSTLFTILSTWALYFLVKHFKLSTNPLFIAILFLVIPPRWVIVHSVGSAEPMFIFFTIISIYAFLNFQKFHHPQWIWLTGLFGLLAQITRPPGILLFITFSIFILWQFFSNKLYRSFHQSIRYLLSYSPLLLIPLSLFGIFGIYANSYQDFWAYFHSGDNIHLQFLPYSVFNKSQFWVGDIWLEDILYIILLAFLASLILLKNTTTKIIGLYIFVYTIATTLVAHRDISRYILPIAPFILIAFEKLLVSKEFKVALTLILLGLYLYTQNFLLQNTSPIPNISYYN